MQGCNRYFFRAVFGVLNNGLGGRMSLYEAFESGGEKGRAVAEFEKMRFELAWRHFDFHAKQRTQMFHFFIILTPFLFGGCFILFKEREIMGSWPPIIASAGGGFLALLFLFLLLDQRNKQLYRVSQSALRLLENQILFTDFRPLKLSGANYPGIISKEKELYGDNHWLKHTTLMSLVYGTAIALFFGLAAYFLAVRLGCIKLPLPSTIATPVSGPVR
jgi:hypothetical protein